jgi:hypothetical protein
MSAAHELVARMRSVLDDYPERVLIGEIYLPLDRLVTYYGKDLKGAQLPFNFALLRTAWNARVSCCRPTWMAPGWPRSCGCVRTGGYPAVERLIRIRCV